MTQEDKKKFYKLLILFSQGAMHDRKCLLQRFPENLVDEAITKGYLFEDQKDAYGEPIYAITAAGKRVWE